MFFMNFNKKIFRKNHQWTSLTGNKSGWASSCKPNQAAVWIHDYVLIFVHCCCEQLINYPNYAAVFFVLLNLQKDSTHNIAIRMVVLIGHEQSRDRKRELRTRVESLINDVMMIKTITHHYFSWFLFNPIFSDRCKQDHEIFVNRNLKR